MELQFLFKSTVTDKKAYLIRLLKPSPDGQIFPSELLYGIRFSNRSPAVPAPGITPGLDWPDGTNFAYYVGTDLVVPCSPNVHFFVNLEIGKISPRTVSSILLKKKKFLKHFLGF